MNESDSERIASFLENKGYKEAPTIEGANLIVINACSVRQTAIDRILGLAPKFKQLKLQNPNLKLILTGCVLKSDRRKFEKIFDSILSLSQLFHGREKSGIDYFSIQPKYKFLQSTFMPIMTGCNNFCSYCVVPYVRGREISRSVKEVIDEVKNLIKRGYKEITLLGQNVNSYLPADGTGQYNFAKLLQKINNLSGNFQIKFLTSHPKDMSDELIETIAECEKISKEIHLPIQSGDNQILKKMNRGYTIKQFKNLIKKIRTKIPEVKISTDVIVGFPGETKKQFQNTVKAFKEIKFDKAYINKYSARAGTLAANLKDDVPLEEKKRRWKIINDIVNKKKKLVVVLGSTASGKSDLAVKLAKEFDGEIISADSRQIYKDMDIGTAKPFRSQKSKVKSQNFLFDGIPHYCLNLVSPKKQFTVVRYKEKALGVIDKIYKKGKIPILCGGTGFYIQAVVEGLKIPAIKPDWKLRKELEKKATDELFKELKKLDPERAKKIDSKNRRRLIRALEIIKKTGKPVPPLQFSAQGGPACLAGRRASDWKILYLGIKKSPKEVRKSINQRVDKMIKKGLEKEVKKLVKKYGWNIVLKNAIGYKEWKDSEDKKIIANAIKKDSYQYAKRQMTWFRKYPGNKKIHWVKNYPQADKLIKKFLS